MNGTEGVYVGCADIGEAERVLNLPNSREVTIGSIPVVVATTKSSKPAGMTTGSPLRVTATVTSKVQPEVTTAPGSVAGSGAGGGGGEEETTTLKATLVSTIIVTFAPSSTPGTAPARTLAVPDSATQVAEEGSLITIVPVAVVGDGGAGAGQAVSGVTVTVTERVTVKEVERVTARVTTTERIV